MMLPNPGLIQAERETNPYLVETITDAEGREIDKINVPGRPPAIKAQAVKVPEPNISMGINPLTNVPAFDWSYGCSATAAAMLFGYYDNDGYHTNMYAGPTNGGVCPMENSVWGSGECPLSATRANLDGRAIDNYGHVDDYWVSYGYKGPDPFIGNWPEHTHGECTGDYMGTNQYQLGNDDGSTTFWFYTNGDPLYDYQGGEPTSRDGGHGLRLFVESRGYTVDTNGNFNQYIVGYGHPTNGFSFDDYVNEIDNDRPVLIHVEGHTMLGFGYNMTGSIVYLHDTWDHGDHTMTWGGEYAGLAHYAVTVLRLEPISEPTWESHKSGGVVDDYFSESGSENTVYMSGRNYTPSTYYKVIFWDEEDGTWYIRQTENIPSDANGNLDLAHTFGGLDTDENWHCTVYDDTHYTPSTYNPADPKIVADDVSYTGVYAFNVQSSAIPEFPTALAAVFATVLSAGIYLWMRRKATINPALNHQKSN
jgi:hypothetical protein